jgi:hypothetical protein
MLFMGVFLPEWADPGLRLLAAMVVTLFLWKPLGSFVQFFFTTKPPTDAQLAGGIKAGKELLASSARASRRYASVPRRFLASGIVHVITGAFIAETLTYAVLTLLRVPDFWRVL